MYLVTPLDGVIVNIQIFCLDDMLKALMIMKHIKFIKILANCKCPISLLYSKLSLLHDVDWECSDQ